MTKISALGADTAVGGSENLLLVDVSASATKRVLTSRVQGAFRQPYTEINWGANTYYQSPYIDTNSVTTLALAANTLYLSPFYLAQDTLITDLALSVSVAAATAGAYMAVYNMTAAGVATTVVPQLAPTSSVDCSTTGVKTISLTSGRGPFVLPAGFYCAAVQTNGVGWTAHAMRGHSEGMAMAHEASTLSNVLYYNTANTWSGSWPSNPGMSTTTATNVGSVSFVAFGRRIV